MTKREKAYIQGQAQQFCKWYEEEIDEANRATDPEEKAEHYHQADQNWAIYNYCENLLQELDYL
ncbi:hypothetical protein [uncultured Oscillibacter sp.]|uniref:hypothetical protein n=1 Tax=uncultured Oscillibacter sp. TaxID=876091 RepID=UPI0025ED59D7|nr:hypothetical protein [uncultured Oscillibacter sp.]